MTDTIPKPALSPMRRFWYFMGFGPHDRGEVKRTPWHLLTYAVLAVLIIADGIITVANLVSPDHPFVVEAMLFSSAIISSFGYAGLLVFKVLEAALAVGVVDYLRHRGYRRAPFILAGMMILLSALVVVMGLVVLTSPPTDPELIRFIIENGLE